MPKRKALLTKQLPIYLKETEYAEMEKEAIKKDISFNQYVRDAINMKIKNDSNDLKKESDELMDEWKEKMKQYDKRVERERYNNWVGKKTYFNGMEDY